ncbi:uncharacterized protein LOC123317926 [Coccinella septempunctata]|uniref:uncharacterized protein LOC123317926 n=1 Tax=Coccinella septempunctata TaxID=41139 RepID=UPI001D094C9C|nr:uncharacterized protein LOC123317926 [Coccinella septempunctata]
MEALIFCASDTMSGWSTSSSDEEEHLKITKIENFVEQTVKQYDPDTFKRHFRMKRETTNELIENFAKSEYSTNTVRGIPHISNETSVLLTMWYLANTESFRQISDRFNVSLSSAHRSLFRVIDFLISIKSR